MHYIVSFLEGVITFISPCLLPMLPVYISYFAGGKPGENPKKAAFNSLGFVLGFTIIFVLLGAFAGLLGGFLLQYKRAVDFVTGSIVILFGLNYIGVLKIRFLNIARLRSVKNISGFFSAVLFGIVFSIGFTPCVGAFLGSALMLASQQGSASKGVLMLFCYSIGLGVPFLLSAVLIDKFKNAFSFIKRNYRSINIVSGLFLIVIGIFMATGMMGIFLSTFTEAVLGG